MSAPLSSLFHGDITIEQGCDTSTFGYGDISVNRQATIGTGTSTTSTSAGVGSLVVYGGVGISENANITGILTVSSTSNLQTTNINTNLGALTVSGGNSAIISVLADVSITSSGGNTSLISSNNNVIVNAGINSANAVQITATNNGGGVNILSGQAGQLQLTAGSGGIQGLTSAGNINLTANNGSASLIVNSSAANQNVTIAQYGIQDSGVIITASGDNTTNTAIKINTTNNAGNIAITNNSGLGNGSITNLTGTGGYIVTTNTGGPIQLSAAAAASYFVVNSTGASQNLTLGVNGNTASQLILQSSGTSNNQAVLIQTTNVSGGILITQPALSSGGVDITPGAGGLYVATQTGGGIDLIANGSTSSFLNQTTANGQDLTVCVKGATQSKLILCSEGTGGQGILLQSTGTSGGIFATANGTISINTSSTTGGINIGTLQNTPINIGTVTSTTTILGNLDVQGTTTTIESQVVQITDNIIQINSGPGGTADSGVGIKRFQSVNNNCLGDVVSDAADEEGTARSGSTATTIVLASGANATTDYYAGWWIKIFNGTGTCQIRRIKSYDGVTKTATIYSTADQTGILGNPTPAEGADWDATIATIAGSIPDNTSQYRLYPCAYILSMWDESAKEYALACSPMIAGATYQSISHYVNLHVNNITANAITATTINGTTADVQATVILNDLLMTGVNVTAFPFNYGVYIVLVRPTIATTTRCYGIFLIGRINTNTNCGNIVRVISVKGTSNEQLDMVWPANSMPQLQYRPAPGTVGNTSFTLKIITV